MRHLFSICALLLLLDSCKLMPKEQATTANDQTATADNKELAKFLDDYFEVEKRLYPLSATQVGDDRYNGLLPVDFTDSYRDSVKTFYIRFQDGISHFDRAGLNENDRLSYDILKWEIATNLEGFNFHTNYIPFNQFYALPLTMGEIGSGEGFQPFLTIKDHEDWLLRAKAFSAWTDSAIVYFRKGMDSGFVLPRSLVVKIIPQMEALITDKPEKSLFYEPVAKLKDIPDTAAASRLKGQYIITIREDLVPSYKKLALFLKNE